ncbi:hypothetical protein DS843_14010 [Roseomonas genomospecies 6]|uniref:Uncharacterized protein n=1 Tax=Roseomonas genomospecies 6 TaxID=214106 RepID=A0A9W7TY09_9PROT|nr:hypothetical protein DS843_14010 [Roseomonas genomospecies 6]
MVKPQPRPVCDPPHVTDDESKLAALKADIGEAYDALMQGRVTDGDVVFAKLYAKFGPPPDDVFEDD